MWKYTEMWTLWAIVCSHLVFAHGCLEDVCDTAELANERRRQSRRQRNFQRKRVLAAAESHRFRLSARPAAGTQSPLSGRRTTGVGCQRQLHRRVDVGLAGAELLVGAARRLVAPRHCRLAADLRLDAANADLFVGVQHHLTTKHLARLVLILLVDVVFQVDL